MKKFFTVKPVRKLKGDNYRPNIQSINTFKLPNIMKENNLYCKPIRLID